VDAQASAWQADREFEGQPIIRKVRAESQSQPGRLVSGNGALILTKQELVFEQRMPNRLLRIPRASIVEISTPRPFGLKIFPKLLKIAWSTETGTQDTLVLKVKDVDGWVAASSPVVQETQ
jgi:hypothetical protein